MENEEKFDGTDRRRSRRVYASFVEYCRVENASSRRFQAFTENISATGICIFVNEEIKPKSLLFVTIYLLDGSDPIETKGEVAWTRPSVFLNIREKSHFDVGVKFLDMIQEDRARLVRYVATHTHEIPPAQKGA